MNTTNILWKEQQMKTNHMYDGDEKREYQTQLESSQCF